MNPTMREELVAQDALENMTFEAFCFIVERETGESVAPEALQFEMSMFYHQGRNTYAPAIRDAVWNHWGRIS